MDRLNNLFPDESACLEFVFKQRYPHLAGYYRLKGRKQYSNKYGHQIAPLAGTIFEQSRTPLRKWFMAIYLFSQSKNGVSALFLSRHLHITYKCAWRMAHRIRGLMRESPIQLSGVVEADETYIGGWNKVRNPKPHIPVLGVVERGGRVNAIVGGADDDSIIRNIKKRVAKGSVLMTDKHKAYRQTGKLGYKHKSVNHTRREYVRKEVHTNTIENFWGQLKRSLRGTHHFVSAKHLQKYVDEFVFRYNNRDPWKAFWKMMGGI